jgi:hypothetical protein
VFVWGRWSNLGRSSRLAGRARVQGVRCSQSLRLCQSCQAVGWRYDTVESCRSAGISLSNTFIRSPSHCDWPSSAPARKGIRQIHCETPLRGCFGSCIDVRCIIRSLAELSSRRLVVSSSCHLVVLSSRRLVISSYRHLVVSSSCISKRVLVLLDLSVNGVVNNQRTC